MKKLLILLLLSGAAFLGFKKFQGNQGSSGLGRNPRILFRIT